MAKETVQIFFAFLSYSGRIQNGNVAEEEGEKFLIKTWKEKKEKK